MKSSFFGLVVVAGLGLILEPRMGAAQMCSDGATEGVDGNGVVCCTTGCTQCGGSGCPTAGSAAGLGADDCCGTNIKASGVYCDDNGNQAPCIIGTGLPTCSDGTTGVDGNGVVCCSVGCTQCGGPGCTTAGASAGLGPSDCCGGAIKSSGVYCEDTGEAPCIIGSADPVVTLCSDGVTEGVDGNEVVCCPIGCTQCGGAGCTAAGEDCCGGAIQAAGVYCDDNGNEAPCILGSASDPVPTPSPVATATCSDGVTEGVDGNGVVCCAVGCTQCGGSGCTTAGVAAGLGADDCCGGAIKASGVYCDDNGNESPCIIGSETDTPAPTTTVTPAPATPAPAAATGCDAPDIVSVLNANDILDCCPLECDGEVTCCSQSSFSECDGATYPCLLFLADDFGLILTVDPLDGVPTLPPVNGTTPGTVTAVPNVESCSDLTALTDSLGLERGDQCCSEEDCGVGLPDRRALVEVGPNSRALQTFFPTILLPQCSGLSSIPCIFGVVITFTGQLLYVLWVSTNCLLVIIISGFSVSLFYVCFDDPTTPAPTPSPTTVMTFPPTMAPMMM